MDDAARPVLLAHGPYLGRFCSCFARSFTGRAALDVLGPEIPAERPGIARRSSLRPWPWKEGGTHAPSLTRREEEVSLEGAWCRRVLFLGPFRSCQPQFVDPHHLEWLIRRLSASSIFSSQGFCAGRPVRSWRRVLWFRRAPPGPVLGVFAGGWVGSRYRFEKPTGGSPRLVGE